MRAYCVVMVTGSGDVVPLERTLRDMVIDSRYYFFNLNVCKNNVDKNMVSSKFDIL